MADQHDPAGERAARMAASMAQFAAAMQPLADAYLHTMQQAGDSMGAWLRQVGAALAASHGQRAELGDPTGDPPIGRGDG